MKTYVRDGRLMHEVDNGLLRARIIDGVPDRWEPKGAAAQATRTAAADPRTHRRRRPADIDVCLPYATAYLRCLPACLQTLASQAAATPRIHLISDGVPAGADPGAELEARHASTVRHYRNTDGPVGPYRSCNRLVAGGHLESPYLAIADADDLHYPDRLAWSIERLASGWDVVGGGMLPFPDPGEEPAEAHRASVSPRVSGAIEELAPRGVVLNPTMALRVEAFRAAGGFEAWPFSADREFVLRAEALGLRILRSDRVVCGYRLSRWSLTGSPATGASPEREAYRQETRRRLDEFEASPGNAGRYGGLAGAAPELLEPADGVRPTPGWMRPVRLAPDRRLTAPLVAVTGCTPAYEPMARALAQRCEAVGLELVVLPYEGAIDSVPWLTEWQNNTCEKPRLMRLVADRMADGQRLVWLDAETYVHRYPWELVGLDADLAARWREAADGTARLTTGTVMLRLSERTRALLGRWYAARWSMGRRSIEQRELQRIVEPMEAGGEIGVQRLGPAWNLRRDRGETAADPVFSHAELASEQVYGPAKVVRS